MMGADVGTLFFIGLFVLGLMLDGPAGSGSRVAFYLYLTSVFGLLGLFVMRGLAGWSSILDRLDTPRPSVYDEDDR